jgi:glycosyltransferase involved in cell wall biosynthesis
MKKLNRLKTERSLVVMLVCQFTEILGGAEKQCATLSSALQTSGEEIVVITSRVPGYATLDDRTGIKVVRLWAPAPPQLAGRYLPASLIWAFQAFIWIFWHRRRIKVIHVHLLRINAYVAAMTQKLLGIPSVMKLGVGGTMNDMVVIGRYKYLLGNAGTRFVARHTSRFVATTTQVRADLISFGVAPETIASIPNGVDLTLYAAGLETSRDSRAATLKSKPVFSYVGRLSEEKNVLAMLNALSGILVPSDTKVMLVGDGPLRATITTAVRSDIGLSNVELLGQVQDVATILHRSHFLLLVSEREGLSNSLLEALAAGVVPILTMTSGTRDAVPFFDYPLFLEDFSQAGITSAVQRACRMDPEEWVHWSEKLSSHAQHAFNLQSVAMQYSVLYSTLKHEAVGPNSSLAIFGG